MSHARRRSAHRTLLAALLGILVAPLLTVVGPAAPAQAVEFTAGRSILKSGCTSQTDRMHWWGGMDTGIRTVKWAKGRVHVCWVKYRLKDRDDSADYYAVSLTSYWTMKRGLRRDPAEMNQIVTSSLGSKGSVYGATNDFTSTRACNESLSVTLSAGPFGATVSPKLCESYKVDRYRYAESEAYWRSPRAGGLRKVETAFVQKVRQGRVPKFDIYFAIPQYRNYWYDAGGYWKHEKKLKWVTFLDR